MLDVPLPAFHMCGLDAPLWTEWAYVGSVAVCGTCPPITENHGISLMCSTARPGGFHLHPCVRNKTQVCPWSTPHVVTPHEDLTPGLVNLFLYHVDFQPHRAGVCGHGEGESEEFPSRVSFCVHLSTIEQLLTSSGASYTGPPSCRTLSRRCFPLIDLYISCSLVPVMVSRIILSLREAADEGLVLCWNVDHLSIDRWNDTNQEMTNLRFSPSQNARGVRAEVTTA